MSDNGSKPRPFGSDTPLEDASSQDSSQTFAPRNGEASASSLEIPKGAESSVPDSGAPEGAGTSIADASPLESAGYDPTALPVLPVTLFETEPEPARAVCTQVPLIKQPSSPKPCTPEAQAAKPCPPTPETPGKNPYLPDSGTGAPPTAPSGMQRRSLGFARSIGWVTLLLLVILSVVLSSYFGSTARDTLLSRQHKFATLLADYLNNQIYRRFTMPTVSFFGRITLSRPEQYKALDQVIQSITNGLQVEELRIYAHDYTVTYSTNHEELGKKRFNSSVENATQADSAIFTIDADIPYWKAFFQFPLKEGTFHLRTTYPLRIENRMGSAEPEGPVMGVLEFTQDISADIESAIRFQQLIMVVTLSCSGILFGLLLVFIRRAERDLTARMRNEQQLVNELHQHEKLAGMGRVVASIAHEIRNPLGIISSSAELLLKRSSNMDTVTNRILQAIFDEARRLSRTVNDFLDYARPRQPNMHPVNVSQVISQALVFLEPEIAQRDIGVVRTGDLDDPLWVNGDKDLLYRAFYNIMGNAIQAMGSAGTLSISLHHSKGPQPMAVISFHDSGPGFPEEHLARLLDPFVTTKDDGTGLGLPIVNSILTTHQGNMTLSNAPEGGAVVTVTLPVADQ